MLTNKTMRKQFTIVLAVYTALIIGLMLLYHSIAARQISKNARESIEFTASSLLKNLNSEISRMKITASAIAGSVYVQDFLTTEDVSSYYEKAATVAEIIRKTTYPTIGADNIFTINQTGTWYRFTGSLSDDACKTIRDKYNSGDLLSYTVIEVDEMQFFCCIMPVYSSLSTNSQRIGAIVLLDNFQKMHRMMSESITGVHTAIIMDDKILLSDNEAFEGQNVSVFEESYEEIITIPVEETKLYAAAAFTNSALRSELKLFFCVSFITLTLFVLTVVILFKILSSKMINPLITKTEKMQMGLLTTQIDAHFIVNTIACIEVLCQSGLSERAAEISKDLNSLIKYQHETGETVNIFTELQMLTRYIEIMNARNQDKFKVSFDVDDRLSEYIMLSQMLQPILENAFLHGFSEKEEGCCVKIKGTLKNNHVYFEIHDNGKGIAQNALETLIARLKSAEKSDFPEQGISGVALVNIQKRIKLKFDDKCGIDVESGLNAGTKVTLYFPAQEDE